MGIRGREHGGSATVSRKPPLWIVRLQPSSSVIAELIADVIGKERLYALFAEIGGAEGSRAGTDGYIGQLEPRLSASIVTIVAVASLEVTN